MPPLMTEQPRLPKRSYRSADGGFRRRGRIAALKAQVAFLPDLPAVPSGTTVTD